MAYNKNSWQDGDIITAEKLNHMEDGIEAAGGLTNDVKTALLQIAEKVAYIDEHGQDYYDDLYDALYPSASLVSISAVYTQSGTVYPTTSLSALKDDLVVTAYYDDTSSEAVPAADYMLSGALTVGTSVITASYNGKTATFNVTVTAVPTVSSISAVYTQSGTVYDTDTLDSLKSDLVVTATYSDSSTATVPSADYTLSGTLTAGTSTITVTYEGKTTTFNVTVSHVSQDTTAQIDQEGKFYAYVWQEYSYKASTNCGATIKYTVNNAPSSTLALAGIIPTDAVETMRVQSASAALFVYDANDNPCNYVTEIMSAGFTRWVQDANTTMTEYQQTWDLSSTPYSKIAFSVDMRYLDDAYMYDYVTGQVYFAGVNTPYYGMTNVSQAV